MLAATLLCMDIAIRQATCWGVPPTALDHTNDRPHSNIFLVRPGVPRSPAKGGGGLTGWRCVCGEEEGSPRGSETGSLSHHK
eukprot:360476-Chlamydomonas_euryale.AAC.5